MRFFHQLLIATFMCTSLCESIEATTNENDTLTTNCDTCCFSNLNVEIRTAYFYPSSHLERQIYKGARFDAELQLSTPLYQNIDLWTNLTYFYKDGHSVGLGERTNLQLIPLTLGLKYIYKLSCQLSLYAGLGINYTWLHLHNDSAINSQSLDKSRAGATWASGIYYQIDERWFSDLFVDYLYIPMGLSNVNNVGGIRVGIGIGMCF